MALPNPTQTNLTPLVSGATAAASLANLALVVPLTNNPSATKGYQPLNPPAINPFFQGTASPLLFHYEGENQVGMESDITDHFVEDNTTVVDQIGIKPEQVTVTGYIGELNNVLPPPIQVLQTLANNLLLVNSYQPQLTVTALIAVTEAELLYQTAASVINSAVSAWSSLTQSTGTEIGATGTFTVGSALIQNKQQAMFQQFYGYWYNRILFNVQTPWAIFTNMAIKNVKAIQDAETRMLSSFEVTFKKIRTAATLVSGISALSQGRAATQSASQVNLGTSAGTPGPSFGSSISAIH